MRPWGSGMARRNAGIVRVCLGCRHGSDSRSLEEDLITVIFLVVFIVCFISLLLGDIAKRFNWQFNKIENYCKILCKGNKDVSSKFFGIHMCMLRLHS